MKTKLKDEQLIQLQNISETLIEATEHFISNIKERQFGQSIHIFSSIVEGYEAINQTLRLYTTDTDDSKVILNKIEPNLVLIAKELEEKNLMKVAEIVQFSLTPNLRKLNKSFLKGSHNRTITIGVFHDKVNPKEIYPTERINALIKESEAQHVHLIFFSSEDVEFETKKIHATVFKNSEWTKQTVDFPNVIDNIGFASKHQQSITERKLRRLIPFTSFGVGNKLFLPKMMVKHRNFAQLLVPFKMITDEQIVYDYIEKQDIAVVKPILGARGERIYFVQKKGNRFTVSDHRHERIYNKENFQEWIQNTLLHKKVNYMIQQYIDCHTIDKEPYDIRAHVQKDSKGTWQITKIYPRIGSKESILSNISRGGRTEDLLPFLTTQFGKQTGEQYNKELTDLSLDLTKYLDRIHNFSLHELGLDLAIDHTGRFWLHEVNNGPQSTYHEEERAIHAIGYAKYIAEKGIVKQNQFQLSENQFVAKTSKLPIEKLDNRHRVGMLKATNDDDKLATACAYVAHYENVQFYTFSPQDIDYNEMLLRGEFYENGKWISKIVEYPDVIYDRLRLKGIRGYNDVYEELEGIPFTNEFHGNSMSKLEVYDQLSSTSTFDDIIIPYQRVHKVRDIFQYIDEYEAVIIKPEVGSFARGVHYISKREKNNYFVTESDTEKEYNEISLRKYLNELISKGTFIVQKYIHTRTIDGSPFDIRVHMFKNRNDEWDFASIYPRIGVRYATISTTITGGYIGNLLGFLDRNFPKVNTEQLKQLIKSKSIVVADCFASFNTGNFNEIALDIALDIDARPYLIEVNVNKPGIVNYEFDVAKLAIPNAIYIAEQNKEMND